MDLQNGIIVEVQKGIMDTPADVRGGYSDGYHTFNELYEFRKVYNAVLFNEWAKQPMYNEFNPDLSIKEMFEDKSYIPMYDVHKSVRHHDGSIIFGGDWFIVSAMLPSGLISNHYHLKDWDLFQVPEVEKAKYEFDGHTGANVLERLKLILK